MSRGLPAAHVVVINRGIGGQDAAEEGTRLQTDALAIKPAVVIWQVGANGALHDTDPALFSRLVKSGLALIRGADADAILMDNQRAPALLASHDTDPIDAALAGLAHSEGAALFSRAALMDAWRDHGAGYERFITSDGLHHNDLGYRCVAVALGRAMLAALR